MGSIKKGGIDMKKDIKKILPIVALAGLLLCSLCLFLSPGDKEKSINEAAIQKAIIQASVVAMECGVLSDDIVKKGINVELSENEKVNSTLSYNTKLASAYASNSNEIENFKVSRESFLNAHGQDTDITINAGVSNCVIKDIEYITDSHVIVTSVTDTWTKRIAGSEEGGFYLSIPINRDTQKNELVKENNQWKVLKNLEFTKEFIDSDDESNKSTMSNNIETIFKEYSNYDDALSSLQEYEITNLE